MSDNEIRDQATELLASVEYTRIKELNRKQLHLAWADLGDDVHKIWHRSFTRHGAALVDAGWRPPPTVISTRADLDALPDGTVVREPNGGVAVKSEDCWELPNTIGQYTGDAINLPVTVLYMPEEARHV